MWRLLPFFLTLTLLTGCASAPPFKSAADELLYNSIESGGDLNDVKRSVSDGASIDKMRRGRFLSKNMVEFAVYNGRPDIASWLIDNGADLSYKTSIMGESLLMYMTAAAEYDLCAQLIERGADVTAPDRLGDTALEYAFRAPDYVPEQVVDDIVTLLLSHGAEIRSETLAAAIGGGRHGLIRRVEAALRDKGIEPNLPASLFYTDASGNSEGCCDCCCKSDVWQS